MDACRTLRVRHRLRSDSLLRHSGNVFDRIPRLNTSPRRGDFHIIELIGSNHAAEDVSRLSGSYHAPHLNIRLHGFASGKRAHGASSWRCKQDTDIQTTAIEHYFSNAEVNVEWNEKFTIDSEVTRIGVYFKTEMAGEIIRDLAPAIFDIREVEVTIRDDEWEN